MSENTDAPATVTNLRDTKRQMAAAKKAHPAGKAALAKKAAANKAPAKAAAKAPAKGTQARRAPQRSSKPPLRWSKQGDGGLIAVMDGVEYAITKSGRAFKATVKKAGKTQTILDAASDGRCYSALRTYYDTGELPQSKKAAAPAKKGA
jgi:hypothetical protein